MKYYISYCLESADTNPNREWILFKEKKSLSEAIKIAIQKSKSVFETEIIGKDENGDLIHHSYYRDGKLKIDMCL